MNMENNKNNKNNKLLITISIILTIIIVVSVGFIGYYIGVNHKNTTLQEIEEPNDKTSEKNKEQELTDINTIKQLSNKISKLFGYNEKELNYNSEYSMFSFKSGVLKKELTNDEKQFLIATGIEWDQTIDNLWESSPKMKNTAELMCSGDTNCIRQYIEASKQVSEEKFNKYSLELFGHEITNPKEVIGKCPIIYYDANQKRYYRPDPACGGAAAERAKLYKYKFTTKEDEAYVYVSFAYVEPDYNNKSIYNVYKDIECNNELIGTCKFINKYEGTKPEHVDDFKLDNTNYQEFSQYKFTFKKDQNKNYYFIKTERIK